MSSTPFNFPPERYSAVYTNDGATSANVSTDNRGQSRVASLSPGHCRRVRMRDRKVALAYTEHPSIQLILCNTSLFALTSSPGFLELSMSNLQQIQHRRCFKPRHLTRLLRNLFIFESRYLSFALLI